MLGSQTSGFKDTAMHIHANQLNLNAPIDAFRASEKAAAKQEAERFRKRLMESASKLAGGSDSEDACIVGLDEHEESERQPKRQNHQSHSTPKKQTDSDNPDDTISAWA